MMIVRYISATMLFITAMVAGLFIIPVLLLITPNGRSKLRLLDNVYGNSADGLSGDSLYQSNQAMRWYVKPFARYNWLAIRNPANNLLRHKLNAEGTISRIEKHGNLTIVMFMNGKRYFFYYNKGGKYIVKFGHRFWADQIKVGEYYNASFVFNP